MRFGPASSLHLGLLLVLLVRLLSFRVPLQRSLVITEVLIFYSYERMPFALNGAFELMLTDNI